MQGEGCPIPWPNSLGPEVIGSQLGIINVHNHPGVLGLGAQDLGAKAHTGAQSRTRRRRKSPSQVAVGAQQPRNHPCRAPLPRSSGGCSMNC